MQHLRDTLLRLKNHFKRQTKVEFLQKCIYVSVRITDSCRDICSKIKFVRETQFVHTLYFIILNKIEEETCVSCYCDNTC